MKFEDIQSLLGQETITGFQSTIASVLESAGGDHDTVCALRELLVSMLAAIVTTTTYLQQSEQLAAEDATQLIALVRKTKEITPRQQPVAPPLALTPVAAEVLMLSVRGAEQGATQQFVPSAEPSRIMAPSLKLICPAQSFSSSPLQPTGILPWVKVNPPPIFSALMVPSIVSIPSSSPAIGKLNPVRRAASPI